MHAMRRQRPTYDKIYSEMYALCALDCIWPGYGFGFQKSEEPDWVNLQKNIGLEVVQGIGSIDGQYRAITNRVLGEPLSDIQDKDKAFLDHNCLVGTESSIDENNLQLHDDLAGIEDEPNRIVRTTMLGKGLRDSNGYIPIVVDAIIKKLQKLNRNYTVFRENHLAVLLGTEWDDREFVEEIASKVSEFYERYHLRFDGVFLLYQESVSRIIFSSKGFEIERKDILPDIQAKIKKTALRDSSRLREKDD